MVKETRADRRKYHYLYKITRIDGSGKYYIGMHSTDDLQKDKYFGSGTILAKSIKKYGRDKHLKEILEFYPTRKELSDREKFLVNRELLNDPLCMNIVIGGNCGFSDEGRDKGQEVCKQMRMIPDSKMSIQLKTVFAEAGRKAIGLKWKNDRDAMIKSSMIGVQAMASERSIKKRKETFANIGHQQDEKNSNFGTCWITDGVQSIRIKKELFPEYLDKGFRKGRKMNIPL